MQHKHKHSIQRFLTSWRERPDYQGTLLTGSVATNTADDGSDIDLRILYTDDNPIHEVGECRVANQTVSFLGTSKAGYKKLFEEDLQTISKFEIRRFAVGEIVEDKDGHLASLQELAYQLLEEPITTFSSIGLLVEKMKISRQYKVLLEMPTTDLFFAMAYFDLIQRLFRFYAKFLQADTPAFIKKKSRYFMNEHYRTIHRFKNFPDTTFTSLYLTAATTPRLVAVEKLYQYTIQQSGGFPDNDFMARFSNNYQQVELFALD